MQTSPSRRLRTRARAGLKACISTAGLALAACLGAGFASAQNEIAQLEIEVPNADRFILRGTVPLPPAIYRVGTPLPLKVRLPNGSLVADTQIEVVSRYPNAPGIAADVDVVEVLARVAKDSTWTVGQRVRFDLVHLPSGTQAAGTPDISALINGPIAVPAHIQALLANPLAVAVVAVDPLGTRYVAYPFRGNSAKQLFRYGPYMATLMTFETMLPESGIVPAGDYPHMFGVSAYLSTQSREGAVMMDLRLNNGADGFDPAASDDDLLGKVYFRSISVLVAHDPAQNWLMQEEFPDPAGFQFGQTIGTTTLGGATYDEFPLVRALPPGPSGPPAHMMPSKGEMIRRTVISTGASQAHAKDLLDQQGLGFAVKGQNAAGQAYWSWYNAATARYFPQHNQIASLDFTNLVYGGLPHLRSTLTARLSSLRAELLGNTPLTWPHVGAPIQLGWARPLGQTIGYEHGGQGISFLEGERAIAATSLDGYRYLQLQHRLHSERHFNVLWQRTGRPAYLDKYLYASGNPADPVGPSGLPSASSLTFYMDDGPSDNNFSLPPVVPAYNQNAFVVSNGLRPAYDGPGFWENLPGSYSDTNLNAYMPHWSSHLTRYIGYPMALLWIGNDPLAKDDVLAQAEMSRMTYTEYRSPYNHSPDLYHAMQFVAAYPNWAFYIGRAHGWMLDVANAAYASQGQAWRTRMRPWYARVVSTVNSGIATAVDQAFINPANGLAYTWGVISAWQQDTFFGYGPSDPRGHQSWEEMILQNGIRGIETSVYSPSEPERTVIHAVAEKTHLSTISPIHWNEAGNMVWGKVPVSLPIPFLVPIFNCDPSFLCAAGSNPITVSPFGTEAGHYMCQSFAQGYLANQQDMFFITRALSSFGGTCTTGCLAALAVAMQASMNPTDPGSWATCSNQNALLGLAQ